MFYREKSFNKENPFSQHKWRIRVTKHFILRVSVAMVGGLVASGYDSGRVHVLG